MKREADIVVVGGGCVGVATALKIQETFPELKLLVLEKESRLAAHQTGHNSGVIHSGIYYKPGSKRATNCFEGRTMLNAFCEEHGVSSTISGKIIVATSEDETGRLEGIIERGTQNGLENLRKIDSKEIEEIEPYIRGVQGVFVPQSGYVDFVGLTHAMAEEIVRLQSKSHILLSTTFHSVETKNNRKIISTSQGEIECKHVVFCGGLQADRLAKADGLEPGLQTVGFRGDYFNLSESGKHKIKNLVYPVPNPEFPFLGVHFTRMFDGTVECGPNAVFTFKREGYGKTDFSWRDTREALGYKGTWRLFKKHWRFGLNEYKRAFSKAEFLRQLQLLCPSLESSDIVPGRSGVRAMALGEDGNVIEDFKMVSGERSTHVLNAPSPAATACLSIGKHVSEIVKEHYQDA